MRKITYVKAINEALCQIMERDKDVFILGQGVESYWYVGDSCKDLDKKFGNRVIDTPVSEAAIAGVANGAAIAGTKPVLVYPRMDWMLLAMDQIVNQAANWHYMFGGKVNVPLVIRGIINRGGEQGAQHSQAIQAIFSHIPGLKVVMPSNPYDAKGLLVSAIEDQNPVIYIDDRWLYDEKGEVPEEIYTVPIGKGNILKEGKDVTIVAVSYMVKEALEAADLLRKENIQAEVIDIRSTKPLDEELILKSVKKTKRLVIADTGWETGGISAEIAKRVYNNLYKELKAPIEIVALPDLPAPASKVLEKAYYPSEDNIIKMVKELFNS